MSNGFNEPRSMRIFFRAMVSYSVLKMILVWPVTATMMAYHSISLPGSVGGKLLLAPSFLANQHVNIFFSAAITCLLIILFTRSNYLGNLVFFWLTFNLYVINLPIGDGSDFVLFMLACWSVPIATSPRFQSEGRGVTQKVLYNLAQIFCQLQVIGIYLVSGLDKLSSSTWRSGEAFNYVRHLEVLYNPILPSVFERSGWDIAFSWSTILFELLFCILVWIRPFRLAMLLIGVIFHLFIWVVLSLPDFALIMIISYLVFLRDSDYETVRAGIRRLLPSV